MKNAAAHFDQYDFFVLPHQQFSRVDRPADKIAHTWRDSFIQIGEHRARDHDFESLAGRVVQAMGKIDVLFFVVPFVGN